MAYMSQEKKAAIAPKIKAVLAKYGIKGSLAVRHHSTLVLNIKSGKINFIENFNRVNSEMTRPGYDRFVPVKGHVGVNPYHYGSHFDGKALAFLSELIPAMNDGNHDRSDSMTDYFDVGWYIDVNIGRWDKPYIVE